MVKFNISGIEYATPRDLSCIKLGQFCKFSSEVVCNVPAALQTVYNPPEGATMADTWAALSDADRLACFEYFAEVVAFWSGAEVADLKNVLSLDNLAAAFWDIELLFASFEPSPDFVGFDWLGVSYFLPAENMTNSTLIEFAEAAQFQANVEQLNAGNFAALLDVMAVLCRPAGEAYDAAKLPKRKKIFSSVGLDVALNVSFFLNRLNVGLMQILAIYSLLGLKADKEATLARLTVGIQQ